MSEKLKSLILYSQENGRVCPNPNRWMEFYKILPISEDANAWSRPTLPLILGAWSMSNPKSKMLVFKEQIELGAARGCLDIIDHFIRGLSEKDWFHWNDRW